MTYIENLGFKLVRTSTVNEINATLYEMEHKKTGASLVYLNRDDENKTFAIGFPTLPKDDTGVFHIIEHSVLCGSKKYPLRDPFAELLKGSLNTFLNAITYEDRTIYPVSSRCEKDFLNLLDVYLDAVFSPNMLENPNIFLQEGWHYEYDEEMNSLSYNGVVYNEMKGAYSSADELGGIALNRALFGGTPYGRDSGGEPTSIPSLTYEEFVNTYKENYHPSRAKIVLDGEMDLKKVLPIIDAHISEFEKREFTIPEYTPPTPIKETTISFEISDTEDEHGKARVLYGFVFGDYLDKKAHLATHVLTDILCGSNASPLKKEIIERGLAKDVVMYASKSRERTLVIEVRDADETRLEEIDTTINEVIISLAEGGIDKDKVNANLNILEFRMRECDFGATPSGIAFSTAMFGTWMYGSTPEFSLIDEEIEDVRGSIESDYFEKLLLAMTVENPRRAKVIMLPDKSLGARLAAEERAELDRKLGSMSKEELEEIIEKQIGLMEWQQTEDSEEAIATLPTLTLEDIPAKVNRPEVTESTVNGAKVLRCPAKTNDIVYLTLHFDASDLCKEELVQITALTSLILNVPTENYDTLALQNTIKENLGSFFPSMTIGFRDGVIRPYFVLGSSSLISKSSDMLKLIREVLLTSKVNDAGELYKIFSQIKSRLEESIAASGEGFGLSRVEASHSEIGAVNEYTMGYEAYKIIKSTLDDEEKLSALAKSVEILQKKLICRRRLTVSVTGDASDEFINDLVNIFEEGEEAIHKTTPPCADKSEFAIVPSKVAYAVLGGRSDRIRANLGYMRVARMILSYEYLWNTIRVKNGAYGAGFSARRDGNLSFYSYRDPSPERAIECFKESSNYLRALVNADIDITKFIIGAIGESDFIITPKTAHALSTMDYLNGNCTADEVKIRSMMLSMKPGDLITAADIIDEALSDASIAVVGSEEHLEDFDEKPKTIIRI